MDVPCVLQSLRAQATCWVLRAPTSRNLRSREALDQHRGQGAARQEDVARGALRQEQACPQSRPQLAPTGGTAMSPSVQSPFPHPHLISILCRTHRCHWHRASQDTGAATGRWTCPRPRAGDGRIREPSPGLCLHSQATTAGPLEALAPGGPFNSPSCHRPRWHRPGWRRRRSTRCLTRPQRGEHGHKAAVPGTGPTGAV